MRDAFATRPSVVFPGAIEGHDALEFVPRTTRSFVLECRPVEHFNRQIELFSQAVRDWAAARETLVIVSSGVSRVKDLLRKRVLLAN